MITDKEHAVVLGLYLMSEGMKEKPNYKKMAKVKRELEVFVKANKPSTNPVGFVDEH